MNNVSARHTRMDLGATKNEIQKEKKSGVGTNSEQNIHLEKDEQDRRLRFLRITQTLWL